MQAVSIQDKCTSAHPRINHNQGMRQKRLWNPPKLVFLWLPFEPREKGTQKDMLALGLLPEVFKNVSSCELSRGEHAMSVLANKSNSAMFFYPPPPRPPPPNNDLEPLEWERRGGAWAGLANALFSTCREFNNFNLVLPRLTLRFSVRDAELPILHLVLHLEIAKTYSQISSA